MIFRNAFKVLLSNFSNVWKVLLYYLICILLTVGVCFFVAEPIINKLTEANVFVDLQNLLNGIFTKENGLIADVITNLNKILQTAWEVLTTNIQFRFNYIFLIVWVAFVFPFLIDLAQLALGEVLYGFMTSQVKYGFTGRYIKNIGKSSIYSLVKYFVQFVLNVVIFGIIALVIRFFTLGNITYILFDFVLILLALCVIAFKYTLFSCWMPKIAVLNGLVVKSLKDNFKIVFKRFFNIFSNCIVLVLTAFVFNFLFFIYTFGVGIILSIPITVFMFASFQMVTYFTCQGMRFYVYPDTFISPKKFEEQDKIKKVKYII